jgi:nucleoside phosphorylase
MNQQEHSQCAVILTALPVEYQAVRHHLWHPQEEVHPESTIYERGIFRTPTQEWEVGLVETRMGTANAAFEAGRAIDYFKPSVVLFVGVAGGLKDVAIGDVVASTKVYGYESGKAGTSFQPRPAIGLPSYRLMQRAQSEQKKDDWLYRLPLPPQKRPRVFVGAIAAGEKVVSSTRSDTWKLLQASYSDALAVEMEGYGFLQAIHGHSHIDALVVRGISDLINGKSRADASGSQELAALHASAFAFEVLSKLGPNKPPDKKVESRPSESQPRLPSSTTSIRQKTSSGDIISPIGNNSRISIHKSSPSRKTKDQ